MAAGWRAAWISVLCGCSFHEGAIAPPGDGGPLADAPGDALVDTNDAAPAQIPAFAASAAMSGTSGSMLSYPLTVPAGSSRLLIVSVQLGTDCFTAVPNIGGVTYNGVALAQLASIVGTPCGNGGTRSDQWRLVDPATGMHDVVISLSAGLGGGQTIHSGALAFTGINQTNPVRASATAKGSGTSSSVTVASGAGDLVVNTVGQGNSITTPGAGQTQRFVHNVSSSNTLNNSAGSTAPGGASVTMSWTFGSTDEWQTISSSLQP